MKVNIDISVEQEDAIIAGSLKEELESFEKYTGILPFFSSDPEEEKKKVKRMKKSLKTVLAWYGAEGYRLEDYL